MQELKKILEEIEEATLQEDAPIYCGDMEVDGYVRMSRVEDIIRKHLSGKDINTPTNDGWIPVEVAPPPIAQRLQATIKHHKWIADYDSDWVPEEEKTIHPERTEVCEIVSIGAMWFYYCEDTDYEKEIAYIGPLKDLSMPVSEIIAWRPLPEPYRPEKAEE